VAGLLLSGLRERSGSLAAPMLLHLSANSGAVLAAWAVQHSRTGPDHPGTPDQPGGPEQPGTPDRLSRPHP
jgi:hypothetical protein